MKKYFILLMIVLISLNAYSQTVNLDGISFGTGVLVESDENFLDGGYFELGYSKIKMTKSGLFYSNGTEFLGRVRFQNSKSGNSIGIITGFKYHFLGSLLSLGSDVEYVKSISSKGGDLNISPNLQLNMFTPELSVVCNYSINLTSNSTSEQGRFLLGLRYVYAFDKGNRFLDYKNKK